MKRPFLTGSILLSLVVLAGALTGCSAEYWTGRLEPVTEIKFNPWSKTISFKNTKDVDLDIESMEYDHSTKTFKLGKTVIKDNASSVIDADAARMQIVMQVMQLQVDYIAKLGESLNKSVESLASIVRGSSATAETPVGDFEVNVGEDSNNN